MGRADGIDPADVRAQPVPVLVAAESDAKAQLGMLLQGDLDNGAGEGLQALREVIVVAAVVPDPRMFVLLILKRRPLKHPICRESCVISCLYLALFLRVAQDVCHHAGLETANVRKL